ncbi:HEM14 [Sanghuangporus vaninii]
MPPSTIAVIGGGITGLSSAFHLSRRFPQASIILLEKSSRDGGWIRSRRIEVKDSHGNKAGILLEAGPRSLRPNSKAILELTNLLNLTSSIITTPKSSKAAKDRFLHIPGRPGLTRLPSSPLSLLSTPYASSILVPSILREPIRRANRPKDADDESVSSLLARRFGHKLERIFGSALVHGIYAADARALSVKATFPILLEAEERGRGSIVLGMLKAGSKKSDVQQYDVGDVQSLVNDAAVFSFVDGLGTIPKSLREYLDKSENVTIRTNAAVTSLRPKLNAEGIEVDLANGETLSASHVVSAISLDKLEDLLPSHSALPHLTTNPMSSVTVVNIVFPPSKIPIHPPGFGYLIPRPVGGYSRHGTGFLGTVFDSCSLGAQDTGAPGFTKLTVMLGGPYEITPAHTKIENVLAQLQHHLSPIHYRIGGARLPWPVYFEAMEHNECIPLPLVGHVRRMEELRSALKTGPWKGKLEVIGASVDGVSVGDCVEAARKVGRDW